MLDIFEQMKKHDVEQITFNYDKVSDTKAITAIHNTTIGPGNGGTRMKEYESIDEAIMDAILLSKAMTYKSAISELNYGGAKTVVIGDPKTQKDEFSLRAIGRFVEAFGGRYITGTDLGTDSKDFVQVAYETDHVIGLPEEFGGGGSLAIPTVHGLISAMEAACEKLYGINTLKDKTIAIQGLGNIGSLLVEKLIEKEAKLIVDNYNPEKSYDLKLKFPSIEIVDYRDIHKVECHIFSPNALGGVLNSTSTKELDCQIIAGAANNQLQDPSLAEDLKDMNILYCPDFVINAGGMIQAADESDEGDYKLERVMAKAENIYKVLCNIIDYANSNNITTNQAAMEIAQNRIEKIGRLKNRRV